LLKKLKNDWKAVCFVLLSKNFGLNVNGAAFLEVPKTTPFSVIRKNWNEVQSLEILFYENLRNAFCPLLRSLPGRTGSNLFLSKTLALIGV
jgi:hypothetical protein